MKVHAFLLPLVGSALILGITSCSQNSGGYADAETAQAVADGTMPPWMAEYSDASTETGSYTSSPSGPYDYNPPAKPSVSSTAKTSTTKRSTTTRKATSKPKPKSTTYIVKKGDSLSVIARRHGSTVKAIKSANGLKSDLIQIKQKLIIPRTR